MAAFKNMCNDQYTGRFVKEWQIELGDYIWGIGGPIYLFHAYNVFEKPPPPHHPLSQVSKHWAFFSVVFCKQCDLSETKIKILPKNSKLTPTLDLKSNLLQKISQKLTKCNVTLQTQYL